MGSNPTLSADQNGIEVLAVCHNRDIPHPEIVDWATAEYLKRTGKIFRDPDRQIRVEEIVLYSVYRQFY